MVRKVVLSWSGGKDCAMALQRLLRDDDLEVGGLLTTITEGYDRISMHGVRRELLLAQAERVGIDLYEIGIPKDCSNEDYQATMKRAMLDLKSKGIDAVAFGDIYLEDVRRYRQENLSKVNMECIFPLWGSDTSKLIEGLIKDGFKAVISCVDTTMLDETFAGRLLDPDLFSDLPEEVDPCGENGEYHSFVFKGPVFKTRIGFRVGERLLRENRFMYCDLLPIS